MASISLVKMAPEASLPLCSADSQTSSPITPYPRRSCLSGRAAALLSPQTTPGLCTGCFLPLAVLPSLIPWLIASSPPLCSNVTFSVNPTLMTPFSLETPHRCSALLYLCPLALTPIQHVIYLFVTFPFWCLPPSVRHKLRKDQDPYLFGSLMCPKQCLDKVGTH